MQYVKVMIVYIVLCAYDCRNCACAWSALDERQIAICHHLHNYLHSKISIDLMATGIAGRISSLGGREVDIHLPTKFGKCVHRSNNVQRLIRVIGNQSMKFGLICY